ncbi:hypothetical protein Tco_1057680 [Tanacetum coccineum]|uniref:Uncharacterized protein n=1 Tax=Tanacetum coccineum TaxID=301880 RepID=A0ABQ5H6M7_9ASTR
MESSSSNSKERELQQMQLEERELHQNCMAKFNELKTHLEFLQNTNRRYQIAFRTFFQEEHETFRLKMQHNLTPFKNFFDSKEVNALDFHNKSWQKHFRDYTSHEPKTYRHDLLWYLNDLDKLIDERVLKYGELRMKESEVQAIKEIEKGLKETELQQQESLVTEGTTFEACLDHLYDCKLKLIDENGISFDNLLLSKQEARKK